jgi:dipeptidyl aminopeptidase/acylaminoacyl peptidase
MNAAGGEPRRVYDLTDQKGRPNRSTWAADSKHILFTRDEAGVEWQLWRLPIDGGKPTLLGLAEHFFIQGLSAHPDGKHIAFSNGPMGGAEIWVMENFMPKNDPEKKHKP